MMIFIKPFCLGYNIGATFFDLGIRFYDSSFTFLYKSTKWKTEMSIIGSYIKAFTWMFSRVRIDFSEKILEEKVEE